jgi:hypothetical protein
MFINFEFFSDNAGTVFAYGVTSSGKTHTMHVRLVPPCNFTLVQFLLGDLLQISQDSKS